MNSERLVLRLDEIIAQGVTCAGNVSQYGYLQNDQMRGFRVAGLSFISRVCGEDSPHYREFHTTTDGSYPSAAKGGVAILRVLKTELEGGWLFRLKNLVAAELFADFVSMAEHLLESGYKDPAAVVAGSVLEEHMRQLCFAASIPVSEDRDGREVHKKADRLNAELAKAGKYSPLNQKQVTAWLAIRNDAAHGKYEAYTKEQVAQMIVGVIDFISRIPE